MGVVVNHQTWQLVERLYVHRYRPGGFTLFLKSKDIGLPFGFYENLDIPALMSTDNRNFSGFMQLVPSYKYADILKEVVFDEGIKNTSLDETKYFNEGVGNWYFRLIGEIYESGFKIDFEKHVILSPENAFSTSANSDLIPLNFNDVFLDHLTREINECYHHGHYIAAMVLSRKLAECLILRLLQRVFWKINPDGTPNNANYLLWADVSTGRVHRFDLLLKNLRDHAKAFKGDEEIIKEICSRVTLFKNETNGIIHKDYKTPKKGDVDAWDIQGMFSLLRKVFGNYCNP